MTLRAVAVLVFTLSWPLQPLDDSARAWVLSQRRPELDTPMRLISDGSRPFLYALAALGLVSGATGRTVVFETLVALVPVNLLVESLKWTVGRSRPDGDSRRRNSAFPSSHAANAFAVATVIARRWRRWLIPAGFSAATLAFSRMYLDRHWLSDVTGSLLVGVAGALLGAWIVRRWRDARDAVPYA
ncbi:MAG: phosphatase PAP2 family protein [Candidatus Eisenbacteria bacterium]